MFSLLIEDNFNGHGNSMSVTCFYQLPLQVAKLINIKMNLKMISENKE